MLNYKSEFIDFMVHSQVLTFGDFVTKSGRKTPFFVNTGKYKTGEQIRKLGDFYAQSILRELEAGSLGSGFNVLFGPAYKGIPLCVATAIALCARGKDVGFCFNRKEAKDHGEGGTLIGHSLKDGDRVLIIEDVTTAGTSIRETVPLLRAAAKVELAGLVVSVDRMERGTGEQNALAEVSAEFGMKGFAIVTIDEVMQFLHNRPINGQVVLTDDLHTRMLAYRREYGGIA
ncbi:MAG TPA: orotate phosphoribosyltransferase [Polyangiaceae bacterium]|nr:orotate phosphoribosyltransferase [Polyangiaceae bacterium]